MQNKLTILLVACALAACGQKPAEPTKSEATQSKDLASMAANMQPGQWRTTITVLEIDAPGMPAEIVAMMKAQKPLSVDECRTSKDIREYANESGDGDADDANCTQSSFSTTGDTFNSKRVCTGEDGQSTITMDGRFSPTRIEGTTKLLVKNQRGGLTTTAKVVSERIGDCTG